VPAKPNPQHDPFDYRIVRVCRFCGFQSMRGDRYEHGNPCPWLDARFEEWRKEHERAG
jgi:hypothetical protein